MVESNNPEATQTPEEIESVDEAITSLTRANLDLLEVLKDALSDFDPHPGALDNLPQVTVKSGEIERVCRLAKDDPRLGMVQLSLIACVDYQEYFQMVYILHCLDPDRTAVIKTDVPLRNTRIALGNLGLARRRLVRTGGPRSIWCSLRGPS